MRLMKRLRALGLRAQEGFTTVTLMGVLAVGGILVAASFAAVEPDIGLSREDQDYKQAYGAAESGLQWYLSSLAKDNNYYVNCDQDLPDPSPGVPAPVTQVWNGTGDRKWRPLPDGGADYTVEILPAPGFDACIPGNQYSVVDPEGNMRLRVTGRARGETRSVVATLRRRNFIDFIYFTEFETLDPVAYSNPQTMEIRCARYRDDREGRGCTEIRFVDSDDVLGPFHTNDNVLVCGDPTFGRTKRDVIEVNGPEPFVDDDCGSDPDIDGTLDHPAGPLAMPPSNRAIADVTEDNYKFYGQTTIELEGEQMMVTNEVRFGTTTPQPMALPENGVIYVFNGTDEDGETPCTGGYDTTQTYGSLQEACGDVWVKGTYGKDLTIAADNDIVIYDHLVHDESNDGLLLGLIANNFVRVYHPVEWDDGDCEGDAAGTIDNLKIQAAMLALRHSFLVDNWRCGNGTGDLIVDGAIAQRFRGPVGTGSGGNISTGYRKDYEYNDRLRYREPPFFLDPVQASWRIARQNEQVPAQD
jgi:hypothetical protein